MGAYAEKLGLVRPSYQQVRLLVNDGRDRAAARRATAGILIDVYFGRRPLTDLHQLLEE